MATHPATKVLGNRSAFFDREVGDAPVRIEHIGCEDCIGRAGFDAARAGTAAVRRRQVGREFERGENHAQKKPRSLVLIDEARVLADPTDSRIFRGHALDDRTGVNITASHQSRMEICRDCLVQSGFHLLKAAQDSVVVVLTAPCVAGNPSAIRVVNLRRVGLISVVVDGANHYAFCPRRDPREGGAFEISLLVDGGQVFHFAGVASSNPFGKMFEFGSIGCGGDAREVEAGLLGSAPDNDLHTIAGTCQCLPSLSPAS